MKNNLAKRIIPCLDVKNGRVVKGINFVNLRDAGDPVETAAKYSVAGADEIVFLDITASVEKRKTMIDVVERTAERVFIPLTVGGGINNITDIRELLHAGCDKISINTAAVKNPRLITEGADKFGSQCIVVAIDAKAVHSSQSIVHRQEQSKRKFKTSTLSTMNHELSTSQWEVYVHGGRTPTGIDVVKWAKKAEKLGAGEILLTSMDKDGTKDGYDIELTRAVSESVNIPVIASGGAGNLKHLYDVLDKGKSDAVLAASIFHYGEYSIKETKQYLKKRGIAIRV